MHWWVGFDFDGTLVRFPDGTTGKNYGADNTRVVELMRSLKKAGIPVKVVSARAVADASRAVVQAWLDGHELADVPITDKKDFHMAALFDDLAISVDAASGRVVTPIGHANSIMARCGAAFMPDAKVFQETTDEKSQA